MTPEVLAVFKAANTLMNERDSGPAGYVFTHLLIPAVVAYLASEGQQVVDADHYERLAAVMRAAVVWADLTEGPDSNRVLIAALDALTPDDIEAVAE